MSENRSAISTNRTDNTDSSTPNKCEDFKNYCSDPFPDFSFHRLKDIPACTTTSKFINGINLSHNLIINLSSGVKDYCLLTHLDISFNKIYSLPAAIFELKYLKLLNVSNNSILCLPPDVCNLSHLEELDVRNNQLKYLPDKLLELGSLKVLLASNNLISTIPTDINRLSQLRILDLNANRLCRLPCTVRLLRWLEVLNVDGNPLTYPPLNIVSRGLPHIISHLNSTSSGSDSYEKFDKLLLSFENANLESNLICQISNNQRGVVNTADTSGSESSLTKVGCHNTPLTSPTVYVTKNTQCILYPAQSVYHHHRHQSLTKCNNSDHDSQSLVRSYSQESIDFIPTSYSNEMTQICADQRRPLEGPLIGDASTRAVDEVDRHNFPPSIWVQTEEIIVTDTNLKALQPREQARNDKVLTRSGETKPDRCTVNVNHSMKASTSNGDNHLSSRGQLERFVDELCTIPGNPTMQPSFIHANRQSRQSGDHTPTTVPPGPITNSPEPTRRAATTVHNLNNSAHLTSWSDLNQIEVNCINRLRNIMEKELQINLPTNARRLAAELCTGVTLMCLVNKLMRPAQPIQVFEANDETDEIELIKMYEKNLKQSRELMHHFGVPERHLFNIESLLCPNKPIGLLSLAHSVTVLYNLFTKTMRHLDQPIEYSSKSSPTRRQGRDRCLIKTSNRSPSRLVQNDPQSPRFNQRVNLPTAWPHHLCSDV